MPENAYAESESGRKIIQKSPSFFDRLGSLALRPFRFYKDRSASEGGKNLTLPETEKRVRELNLKGFKKYLYVSFFEFVPMVLSMPKKFAFKHRKEDREAVLKTTRIIWAAQYAVSVLVGSAVVAVTGITAWPFLLALGSVFISNMVLHGFHNYYVDRQREKNQAEYSEELSDPDIIIKKYFRQKQDVTVEYLKKDMAHIQGNIERIKELFEKPYAYKDGIAIKDEYVKLFETMYYLVLLQHDASLANRMFKIIEKLYPYTDSLRIQHSIVENTYFEDYEYDSELRKKLYYAVRYYFFNNLEYLSVKDADEHDAYDGVRLQNTYEMAQILISNALIDDLTPEEMYEAFVTKERFGPIAAQIMHNAYTVFYEVDQKELFSKLFGKRRSAKIADIISASDGFAAFVKKVRNEGLPEQLIYHYICSNMTPKENHALLMDKTQDIEHRMMALRALAAIPYSTDSLYSHIYDEDKYMSVLSDFDALRSGKAVDAFAQINKDKKPLFGKETNDELYKKVTEYLSSMVNTGIPIKGTDENYFMPTLSDVYKGMMYLYIANTHYDSDYLRTVELLKKIPDQVIYKNTELSMVGIDHMKQYTEPADLSDNRSYFRGLANLFYGNENQSERLIDKLLNESTGNYELQQIKKIADRLKLQGVPRAFFASLFELPFTLQKPSEFVNMHYKNRVIDEKLIQSEGYQTRLKGARSILRATMIGVLVGSAMMAVAFFILPAVSAAMAPVYIFMTAAGFNIIKHTAYNLDNPLYPLKLQIFGFSKKRTAPPQENAALQQKRSVLPENESYVDRLVAEGKSALGILVRVAFKEAGATFNSRFFGRHQNYGIASDALPDSESESAAPASLMEKIMDIFAMRTVYEDDEDVSDEAEQDNASSGKGKIINFQDYAADRERPETKRETPAKITAFPVRDEARKATFKEEVDSFVNEMKAYNLAPAIVQGATVVFAMATAFIFLGGGISYFYETVFFENMLVNTLLGMAVLVVSSLFAGASANIVSHIAVNYRFVKEKIALRDLRRYGVPKRDGKISVPMYVISEMPRNHKEFGFKNTGIKVNGKSLWVSSESGSIVVFAEGADFAEIERCLKGGNKRLNAEISRLIKKATGRSLSGGRVDIDWAGINANAAKNSFFYGEDGSLIISLAEEDGSISAVSADFIESVRNIRNADTMAAVQNIYYHLDNIASAEDLYNCLGDFQKIGNGQIILDYSVLADYLNDYQIQKFFEAARLNGVKIIADVRSSDAVSDYMEYADLGFDGILYQDRNSLQVYDFALANGRKASVVEGYANSSQLIQRLRESGGDIKILNNSDIVSKLADDRSIIDRVQVLKVLRSLPLLGILKRDKYDRDFVKNAAYNLSPETLSALSGVSPAGFEEVLRAGNVEGVKRFLNLKDTDEVAVYLNDIEENVDNKFNALLVQKAFLEGVLEKMLVSQTVAGIMTNKDLEKTLGKALRLKVAAQNRGVRNDEIKVSAQEFKESIRQKYLKIYPDMKSKEFDKFFRKALQIELSAAAKYMAEDAFNGNDAVALNGIIELIPAIAQVTFDFRIEKNNMAQFDVREMKNLLAAA